MDFGFINSILRGSFLPPKDHFLGGEVINYYYFGHFVAAVLFRLSRVPPSIAYHLQMSNLTALTFVESFAIGSGIYFLSSGPNRNSKIQGRDREWRCNRLLHHAVWKFSWVLLFIFTAPEVTWTLSDSLHSRVHS